MLFYFMVYDEGDRNSEVASVPSCCPLLWIPRLGKDTAVSWRNYPPVYVLLYVYTIFNLCFICRMLHDCYRCSRILQTVRYFWEVNYLDIAFYGRYAGVRYFCAESSVGLRNASLQEICCQNVVTLGSTSSIASVIMISFRLNYLDEGGE